jgi:hypothetical protein
MGTAGEGEGKCAGAGLLVSELSLACRVFLQKISPPLICGTLFILVASARVGLRSANTLLCTLIVSRFGAEMRTSLEHTIVQSGASARFLFFS